jgi:hypothetical protein
MSPARVIAKRESLLHLQPGPAISVTARAIAGLSLLLAGCVNPVGQPNELVIREDLETFCSSENRPTESFELVTHRDWQRGVVMLYEGVCGPAEPAEANSPLYVKGYKVFEREGLQWQPIGAGSVGMKTPSSEAAAPISYTIGYAPDDDYVLVEGQIHSPEVAAVEAYFGNNTLLRDSGEDDRFAIVAAGAGQLCELLVVDDNEQVIFRDQVSGVCESSPVSAL